MWEGYSSVQPFISLILTQCYLLIEQRVRFRTHITHEHVREHELIGNSYDITAPDEPAFTDTFIVAICILHTNFGMTSRTSLQAPYFIQTLFIPETPKFSTLVISAKAKQTTARL